ncbi:MAG: CHAP domain-containing protein [Flavobacteriales bacterium]|nr:CHAP domain-containing protein [Flavobacteriales bacterium]
MRLGTIILLFLGLAIQGLAQDSAATDLLPGINQHIVDFAAAHLGKKVDCGECWDLAAGALNEAGAKWDGAYGFGSVLDWRKQEILPGDIVQFEGVTTERRIDGRIEQDIYGKHTAIVVVVQERGVYTIAHQNFGNVRKVATTVLRLADVRGGKLIFYRPVPGP